MLIRSVGISLGSSISSNVTIFWVLISPYIGLFRIALNICLSSSILNWSILNINFFGSTLNISLGWLGVSIRSLSVRNRYLLLFVIFLDVRIVIIRCGIYHHFLLIDILLLEIVIRSRIDLNWLLYLLLINISRIVIQISIVLIFLQHSINRSDQLLIMSIVSIEVVHMVLQFLLVNSSVRIVNILNRILSS